MKPTELAILLSEGEGSMLEYKESLSASFARSLVALANTVGGKILLGVRDDGSIRGIKDSNEVRARIQDIARNCDPAIDLTVESVAGVLVVSVHQSSAKPVQCSDGFFWRQGAGTQKLTREELRDFFRSEGSVRFDLAQCRKFRYPADFDRAKFKAWLRLAKISTRARAEDVLVNIEVAERSGRKLIFRHAGVLLFAKHVRRFVNHGYITCLLASGTGKANILDRKDFDGGIVADIEDAMRFIERNTRASWSLEAVQRTNVSDYPLKALREAITNAVVHRDWFVDGSNVFVEIYDDRIEVSNPGGLPKGMTLADLGRKCVRRNPLIADLLHRIDFIEKAGTGIRRIRDEVRTWGGPAPLFETTGFFTTTIYPIANVRTQMAIISESEVGAQSRAQSRAQSTVDRVDQSARVLVAISVHALSPRELTAALGLGCKSGALKRVLRELLEGELIAMTIPERRTSRLQKYRITQRGVQRLAERTQSK